MRIYCPHCQTKALITSSNRMSETVQDIYSQCMNTKDCGASFVFSLAFKHDINPPAKTVLEIARNLVNNLDKDQKQSFQQDVFS